MWHSEDLSANSVSCEQAPHTFCLFSQGKGLLPCCQKDQHRAVYHTFSLLSLTCFSSFFLFKLREQLDQTDDQRACPLSDTCCFHSPSLYLFSQSLSCYVFLLHFFWTSCCAGIGALAIICCHSTAKRSIMPRESLAISQHSHSSQCLLLSWLAQDPRKYGDIQLFYEIKIQENSLNSRVLYGAVQCKANEKKKQAEVEENQKYLNHNEMFC